MLIAKFTTLMIVMGLANFSVGEVCYVCGNSKELISNPDSIIPIPEEYGSPNKEVDCKTIALAGMNGLIPDDACSELRDSLDFKLFCGCGISSDTNDVPSEFSEEASPSLTPVDQEKTNNPTFSVSEYASTAGSARPSSIVETQKPIKYIPTDAHSNEEETEIPSTSQTITDGEGKNDVPWLASSNLPSATPSDVPSENPSNVPSSFPSDAPSDVPSAQPTADRDVSGVVVESSANKASLAAIARALPTVVMAVLLASQLI